MTSGHKFGGDFLVYEGRESDAVESFGAVVSSMLYWAK